MPVIVAGAPRIYHAKFRFTVEIGGVAFAGFNKCSELTAEAAEIQQWEGGSTIPHKSPGRITYADITLERGATRDRDLFDWFSSVQAAGTNAGLVEPDFRRDLDIVQQERDTSTILRWRIFNAWTKKYKAGDWDNSADENVMESVTLAFDYFDLV